MRNNRALLFASMFFASLFCGFAQGGDENLALKHPLPLYRNQGRGVIRDTVTSLYIVEDSSRLTYIKFDGVTSPIYFITTDISKSDYPVMVTFLSLLTTGMIKAMTEEVHIGDSCIELQTADLSGKLTTRFIKGTSLSLHWGLLIDGPAQTECSIRKRER